MYLLDTNVISELRKLGDGKADARVEAWVSEREATSFYISALTLMNLRSASCASNGAIPGKESGCGPGWTGWCCPNSRSAHSPSIPLSH